MSDHEDKLQALAAKANQLLNNNVDIQKIGDQDENSEVKKLDEFHNQLAGLLREVTELYDQDND